jgi:hypothetical protein
MVRASAGGVRVARARLRRLGTESVDRDGHSPSLLIPGLCRRFIIEVRIIRFIRRGQMPEVSGFRRAPG